MAFVVGAFLGFEERHDLFLPGKSDSAPPRHSFTLTAILNEGYKASGLNAFFPTPALASSQPTPLHFQHE